MNTNARRSNSERVMRVVGKGTSERGNETKLTPNDIDKCKTSIRLLISYKIVVTTPPNRVRDLLRE